MCGNASCILYFKQNINTHVKKLCFSRPATIDGPTAGKHYKYGGQDADDDDDHISIAESTDTSR